MEGSGRSVIWGTSSAVDWGKPRTNRSQGRRPRGRDWNRDPAEYEAGVLTTSMWPSEDASWLLIIKHWRCLRSVLRISGDYFSLYTATWCDKNVRGPLVWPPAGAWSSARLPVGLSSLSRWPCSSCPSQMFSRWPPHFWLPVVASYGFLSKIVVCVVSDRSCLRQVEATAQRC
jgi:hypothetical protein